MHNMQYSVGIVRCHVGTQVLSSCCHFNGQVYSRRGRKRPRTCWQSWQIHRSTAHSRKCPGRSRPALTQAQKPYIYTVHCWVAFICWDLRSFNFLSCFYLPRAAPPAAPSSSATPAATTTRKGTPPRTAAPAPTWRGTPTPTASPATAWR